MLLVHSETSIPAVPKTHRWKYKPTPLIDKEIEEAYAKQRSGDRSALSRVSREIGWPRDAVCKRGAELGLARIKERPWSAMEEIILERFGHMAPSGIQRQLATAGFFRSIGAIQVKLNRNRIKGNLDGYSACKLADAFGVDVHKVMLWIRRGLLRASRRGTDRVISQGGDIFWIPRREVKRFILRAPEEIDLGRVEKIWFLDLLTGGKLWDEKAS